MKNKLLLCAVSLFTVASISSASARTDGFKIGAYGVQTDVEQKIIDPDPTVFKTHSETATSAGIDFGYKLKLGKNFFVTPSVFYENIGTDITDFDNGTNKLKMAINSRGGVKANAGFEFADRFSIYGTLGLAAVSYEIDWNIPSGVSYEQTGATASPMYGVGVEFAINEHIAINAGYTMQSVDIEIEKHYTANEYEVDLKTATAGVSFYF